MTNDLRNRFHTLRRRVENKVQRLGRSKLLIRGLFICLMVVAIFLTYQHFAELDRIEAVRWIESKGGTVVRFIDEEPNLLERYVPWISVEDWHDYVEFIEPKLNTNEQELLGNHLRNLGSIDTLALAGGQVDDAFIQRLGKQPRVKRLRLKETRVRQAQIEKLYKWSSLRQIYDGHYMSSDFVTRFNQKLTKRYSERW